MGKHQGWLRLLLRLVCVGCAAYVVWHMAAGVLRRHNDRALAEQVRQLQPEPAGPEGQPWPEPAGPAGLPEQMPGNAPSEAVPRFGPEALPETEGDGAVLPEMLPEYRLLYEENSDLAGWLTIEGTEIDYPVMRSEDDAFYLTHDFQGREDRYGCLFIRSLVDISDPGANVIVYGHNMKDGAMFGGLDRYADEKFYREHPTVRFDTLYTKGSYEIIGAFRARVLEEDEEGFRYYDFYEAQSREDFEAFYDSVKELSLYDTGAEAGYGDRLLTLSTCSYHTGEGRFVVVARKTNIPAITQSTS